MSFDMDALADRTESNASPLARPRETIADHAALPLDPERLQRAKRSYAARHLPPAAARRLLPEGPRPRAGQLLLARVLRIGHHAKLELANGRRAALYEGDELVLVYADRYASDQFEARVPDRLEPCHLIAAGGIAAQCLSRHERSRRPTEIAPVGLLADAAGRPLDIRRFAPLSLPGRPATPPCGRPRTIAVLGTAMNAGKTTTVAALIRGLRRCGLRVGAAKVTGTGAGGDRWSCLDAGAEPVLDFTDFGFPSTHRLPATTHEALLAGLLEAHHRAGSEVVIVEIADGLLFEETARLVTSPLFRRAIDGIVLAAADAMGALGAVQWLTARELVPLAIGGRVTTSPLARRELESTLGLPVVDIATIVDGRWLPEPALGGRAAA